MQTMYETYQSEGLVVLAIGNGVDQAGCQTWISQWGLTHPVLADPTRIVYPFYGDGFVPYNAIIDGDGVLLYTDSGFDQTLVTNTIEQALLRINHVPMPDSEDDVNPYTVNCSISSVNALVPGQLVLHWNTDGSSTFNDVSLTTTDTDAYTEAYSADIPAQSYGTTVYYYLAAGNVDGRTTTDPTDAPTGLHTFYVGVDSTPPVIDHEPLVDYIPAQWPVTVSATVTDNQGIDTVTLEFMINGGAPETVSMTPAGTGVYSAELFGSVSVGDMIEYRITAVDVAAASNSDVDPDSGYHVFSVVEPLPVFIFEPDGTPLSGAAIALELDAMGIAYDTGTTLPENPSLYRSIFACLGVYSTNHTLTQTEGQELVDFLDLGGRVYMEGGDTWAYDTETAVHPYFHIEGLADGTGDAGPIQGAVGTLTDGMYFQYAGGNSYIDHISPIGGAEAVFLNVTPQYLNGVAYDGGIYRTIGTSFEFGGLVDGTEPSTKSVLLTKILEFFEMDHLIILFEDGFESGDTSAWN